MANKLDLCLLDQRKSKITGPAMTLSSHLWEAWGWKLWAGSA